jgi:hypothetical protein
MAERIREQHEDLDERYKELIATCEEKTKALKNELDRDLAFALGSLAKANRALHGTLHHRSLFPDEIAQSYEEANPDARTAGLVDDLEDVARWREVVNLLPEYRHAGGGTSEGNSVDDSERIWSIKAKEWALEVLIHERGRSNEDSSVFGSGELRVFASAHVPHLPLLEDPTPLLPYVLQGQVGDSQSILSPESSLIATALERPPQDMLATIADRCKTLTKTITDTLAQKTAELESQAAVLGSRALPPTPTNIETAVKLAARKLLAEGCKDHTWSMVEEFWPRFTDKLQRELETATLEMETCHSRASTDHQEALEAKDKAEQDLRQARRSRDKANIERTWTDLSQAVTAFKSKKDLMALVGERLAILSADSNPEAHAQVARDYLTLSEEVDQPPQTPVIDQSGEPDWRWTYYTPPSEHPNTIDDDVPLCSGSNGVLDPVAVVDWHHDWLSSVRSLESIPQDAEDLSDNPAVRAIIREIITVRSKVATSLHDDPSEGNEESASATRSFAPSTPTTSKVSPATRSDTRKRR